MTNEIPDAWKSSVISEVNEQEARKSNFVVFKLAEVKSDQTQERVDRDTDRIIEISGILDVELKKEDVKKVVRLGPYNPDNTRPLLVELHDVEIKKKIFRSLGKLKDVTGDYAGITISHDMTKAQMEINKKLVNEAKNMQAKSQGDASYTFCLK